MGFNRHRGKILFSSSVLSMIKCVACINHYGDIIKKIDKSNATVVCPAFRVNYYWEHTPLCENSKENIEV